MDVAPQFTADELTTIDLPGFNYPATLLEMVRPGTDWLAAMSLSLYRLNPEDPGQLQTLTGIRRGAETHDRVVSTLTGFFPALFQMALVSDKHDYLQGRYPIVNVGEHEVSASNMAVAATYRPNREAFPDLSTPLPFINNDIVTRKLELPEWTQRRPGEGHVGTISLSRVIAGFSYVDEEKNGTPLWEPLLLYGGAMLLKAEFADAIPTSNKRYYNLGWTDVTSFAGNVKRRDVEALVPAIAADDDIVGVCARGLCLATTSSISESPDLAGHLGLG